jgi:hypothetical protein
MIGSIKMLLHVQVKMAAWLSSVYKSTLPEVEAAPADENTSAQPEHVRSRRGTEEEELLLKQASLQLSTKFSRKQAVRAKPVLKSQMAMIEENTEDSRRPSDADPALHAHDQRRRKSLIEDSSHAIAALGALEQAESQLASSKQSPAPAARRSSLLPQLHPAKPARQPSRPLISVTKQEAGEPLKLTVADVPVLRVRAQPLASSASMDETTDQKSHTKESSLSPGRPFIRAKTDDSDGGKSDNDVSGVRDQPRRGSKAALSLLEFHSQQMELLQRKDERGKGGFRRASSMRNRPSISIAEAPESMTVSHSPVEPSLRKARTSASSIAEETTSFAQSSLRQSRLSVVEFDALRRVSSKRESLNALGDIPKPSPGLVTPGLLADALGQHVERAKQTERHVLETEI